MSYQHFGQRRLRVMRCLIHGAMSAKEITATPIKAAIVAVMPHQLAIIQ